MKLLLHVLSLGCLFCTPAYAVSLPGMSEFIEEMVQKHQFDRGELTALFEQANHRPLIIEAISRPATFKPWPEYREAFVNKKRVKLGLAFWDKYRSELVRAEKQYGVPQEIIVALIGVETIYGKNSGHFRTLDALTTLAFDYPRRSAFFRDELSNYLLLAREQQMGYLDTKSSYAGALGIPQFMPSSYRKYAVDFNENQKIDLFNEPVDAIGSVGNYLKNYGWLEGGPIAVKLDEGAPLAAESGSVRLLDYTVAEGKEYWSGYHNFDVITRYNHSDYYAMSVFLLGQALKAARQ